MILPKLAHGQHRKSREYRSQIQSCFLLTVFLCWSIQCAGAAEPPEEGTVVPQSVQVEIDWESAKAAHHDARSKEQNKLPDTFEREVTRVPVPVLFPINRSPKHIILQATDAGYFGSDTSSISYNFHITGTNWMYRSKLDTREILNVRDSVPVITEGRDGGLNASFRRFGAVYVVEIICAEAGPCISQAALLHIVNSLVVLGGKGINE